MFAGNGKISPRQAGCLLFVDWVGKLLLLLPSIRGSLDGWEFIAAVALGGAWTFLYMALLEKLSWHIRGGFTGFLEKRIGRYPARLAGGLFFLYLLFNLTYLARLTGRICREFLLPETSETLIAVCVLAAGVATALGDSQKRARTAEFLFWPIAAALGAMLLASAGAVQAQHFLPEGEFDPWRVLRGSGSVFAGFSGIVLLLYEVPHISWTGRRRLPALGRGLLFALVFLLAAFFAALGVLGEAGFARLPWPVLTLMGRANLPGGFLRSWDAVFLSFLLFALLTGCGTSCHYLKRVVSEVFVKKDRERLLLIAAGPALACVLLTRDFDTAAALFYRWSLCGLVPVVTAVPVLLAVLEKLSAKKGRSVRR